MRTAQPIGPRCWIHEARTVRSTLAAPNQLPLWAERPLKQRLCAGVSTGDVAEARSAPTPGFAARLLERRSGCGRSCQADTDVVVAEREADYLRQLRAALGATLTRAEARREIPDGVPEARTEVLVPLVIAFNVLVASSAPASVARGVLEAARTIAAAA